METINLTVLTILKTYTFKGTEIWYNVFCKSKIQDFPRNLCDGVSKK